MAVAACHVEKMLELKGGENADSNSSSMHWLETMYCLFLCFKSVFKKN
jgi:hypothetical protein